MSAETAAAIFYTLVIIPSGAFLLYKAYEGWKPAVIMLCVFISMWYYDGKFKKDQVIRPFFEALFGEDRDEGTSI